MYFSKTKIVFIFSLVIITNTSCLFAESSSVFLTTLSVENYSSNIQKIILVQGGIPFAQGIVKDVKSLELLDSVDAQRGSIPLQARAIAFWQDGSIKWAELTFVAKDLNGHERRTWILNINKESGSKNNNFVTARLPEGLVFELEDIKGGAIFVAEQNKEVFSGFVCSEKIYYGYFKDRKDMTEGRISVTYFPELNAFRYRFKIKQLVDGQTWHSLKAILPHRIIRVHRAKELHTVVKSIADDKSEVIFFRDKEAVDRGVGRQWEFWAYINPELFQSETVRPRFSPRYLNETQALGRLAESVSLPWEAEFEESVSKVIKKRDLDPKNFGWLSFGDFFDREHSVDYSGYINQEYDQAIAFFHAYFRTGNERYLTYAEDLASFYRDMCISPEGGSYQHRATKQVAFTHVINILSDGIKDKLTNKPARPSYKWLITEFRELFGNKAVKLLQEKQHDIDIQPVDKRVDYACRLIAMRLFEAKEKQIINKFDKRFEDSDPITLLYKFFVELSKDKQIKSLGFSDAKADFRSFFERYGGSWSNFPSFHLDNYPDFEKRHSGGHSLIEMVVLAYFLTGDESYSEVALTFAEHQLKFVIPNAIETIKKQINTDANIYSRTLGWPLINLLSLWSLTQYQREDLHERVSVAVGDLISVFMSVPYTKTQGSIHAGIVLEGLCRYHEMTHDDAVLEYIVDFASYWSKTQWNGKEKAFLYHRDQKKPAWHGMTGLVLYGLAYANYLSFDESLEKRVHEAVVALESAKTSSYAKTFAMLYRSTSRALAYKKRKIGK